MISIVGIGNAGSAIAEKFKSQSGNYKIYQLNNKCGKSKYCYKLKEFDTPEEYEKNIPDLTTFFKDITDKVQVFIVGSSKSSNYALGILEQIRDKELEIFYVKPDTELLTGVPKLLENMTYGVLQQYARSALFASLTIFSNYDIEKNMPNISIKNYFDTLNQTIFSSVHYLNFFTHTEPEIGQVSRPHR